MARIEIYGNDSNVTLDDKVIGTDALDNSTKNFTVGDIVALASGGGTGVPYTAGAGIDITNNVISSTIVDTDTNKYVSAIGLVGTDLDLDFNDNSVLSVSLATIADKTVLLTGTGGIAVTGTYPSFTIDGSAIGGGGGGTVTGTGIANIMTKWLTSTSIGNSIVVEDGNGIGIGVNPPEARLHVHNPASSSSIKITTQGSNIGPQDGLDIALVDGLFAQMWLYEPNISLRFGTANAERFSIDGAGQGWFKYGLRITGGIVDSNTTKGTAGQILSSTGTEVEWINAPSGGSTTLTGLTDTTISNPVAGDSLEYDGTAWVNTPGAYPERLILRSAVTTMPIGGNEPDFSFAAIGPNVANRSVHIKPSKLNPLLPGAGFGVLADCRARISLGAFINAGGHSGEAIFRLYEMSTGTQILVGQASFTVNNQATVTEAFSFFSFFDFLATEEYLFTLQTTQTTQPFTLDPNTFVEVEIIEH